MMVGPNNIIRKDKVSSGNYENKVAEKLSHGCGLKVKID